jgi:hypothetical protein
MCTPDDLAQLGAWIAEARSLVPADSIYRRRIDLIDQAVYQNYLVKVGKFADELPILAYGAPEAAEPPEIDGRLDDAAWANTAEATGFVMFNSPEPADPQTSFRVTYDQQAVYFGVTCHEPEMDRVESEPLARDDHEVFKHETVEIFLDPDDSHQRFYQLAINVAGSMWDGTNDDLGKDWNSQATCATSRGESAWYVEIAIPWSSLGIQPGRGHLFGFNVCRDRYIGASQKRGAGWMTWAQIKATFHDTVRFGHLVLSGTPEQMQELGPHLRKGRRGGPIRITPSAAP